MKLFVVRHGETENNVAGVVQGITDSNLTENGIEAAKKLRGMIQDKKIDRIISSPLKRARKTAEIISDGKLPINIDDRIIERDFGLNEQISINIVDRVTCWNYYLNSSKDAIEPIQDFMVRIREFLWEIRIKYEDDVVLLVTHSAVCRAIYYYVNGIPEDGDLKPIGISNLGILEFEI